jgi:hypothetical protein
MSPTAELLRSTGPAGAARPALRIEALTVLPDGDVDVCWSMYRAAFDPLRSKAATRHVMYREEFAEAMADPRLEKLVGFDRTDRPVGMALVTRDLRAIPWISPEFFAARYPEETDRGAVTYVGFVLVDPAAQGGLLFSKLVHRMTAPVAAEGGVIAFDMCTFNASVVRLPQAILRAIRRRSRAEDRVEDLQTFYALRLSEKDA